MSSSPAIVVLTGAGLSADSGVPTFRPATGGGEALWEGVPAVRVATPEGWRRDPDRVWRFYQARRRALLEVEPNVAHHALVALEARVRAAGGEFLLVTQNVDGLHERAGSRPLAMHGALSRLACEACGAGLRDTDSTDDAPLPCPSCAHPRLRPDVVWFGEVPHHLETIAAATAACTEFLALGTSGVVLPAAGFLALARECGARTWVQSLDAPENLDPADRFRPGRAAEVVPALLDELAEELDLPPG